MNVCGGSSSTVAVIAHYGPFSFRARFRSFDFSLFEKVSFIQIDHVSHETQCDRLINAIASYMFRINQICVFEILTNIFFNVRVEIIQFVRVVTGFFRFGFDFAKFVHVTVLVLRK